MNSVRLFLMREGGKRIIHSSSIFYSPAGGSNCSCDLTSKLNTWRHSPLSIRNLRTSSSLFQLSKRQPLKNDESEERSMVKVGTSSNTSSQTLPDLNELLRRQRELQTRLVEEPEETEPHVIYKGILGPQLKRVKAFSLTTSVIGLIMQPIIIREAANTPLAASIALFATVGFFTYVTPFLIHLIAKKYVTEMMYDPRKDTYTATTYTFFLRRKETVFKIDDVEVPEVPGPFSALKVKIEEGKTVPLFVAAEAFIKPSHYGRMMGYDKPIDLHLNVENPGKEKDR